MVKQLTRSAVRIYGALSALGNNTGSVLEGLLPFFDPILRQHNGELLDPNVVASKIRSTYHWNFNVDLVEAFVPHLARHGWLVANLPNSRDTTYTIQMTDAGRSDPATDTVEAELRRLAQKFKEFSEQLSPLTALPRDVEEFEDILVEWLLYVEAFSEESVNFTANVRPDENGKLRQIFDIPRVTTLRDDEKFLCARFVKFIVEQNEGGAEILARIAAIGLLTEVVQDFVKPVDPVDKSDLVVYLDAPVAMELLGVSGRLARENTAPVVEELQRIGASLRVFNISIDEIKNSLGAVLKNARPTGPTATAMARGEVLKQFVVDVANDPTPFLEQLGVQVAHRSLEQTPSEHQYFTDEQRNDLYSRLRYAENPHARDHDANITTFAARQRRGRTSRDVFRSNAVVLTRNGLLAQIVRATHLEAGGAIAQTVPPVIHRRVMATAMWLRTGLGAGNLNIPKRMLLATCERVLAIRPGVVDAVKKLTDALGDEEKTRQLDLLVSQDRSSQVLMDKTLGLSNVVTAENLDQLWSEMLDPHIEVERQRGLAATAQIEADGKRKLAKAKLHTEALIQKRASEAAVFNEEITRRLREDRDAIESLCSDVARRLRNQKMGRITIAVAIAAVSAIPTLLETTPLIRTITFGFGLVFAYLTATGGKIFALGTDADKANAALAKEATRRSLTSKLSQFEAQWDGSKFQVLQKPLLAETSQDHDLLTAETHT
jgi:hypothetical protein